MDKFDAEKEKDSQIRLYYSWKATEIILQGIIDYASMENLSIQ